MTVETRPAPAPAADLIDQLVAAAEAAIRNQEPSLTHNVGRLRSVTLELELSNLGAVIESRCWVERRGVHRATKGAAA